MSAEVNDRGDNVHLSRRMSPTAGRESPSLSTSRTSKLNQLVQNFYMKVALLVIQSRQSTTPVYNQNSNIRMNRWFNIEAYETDAFAEDLRFWKTMDVSASPFVEPTPLIVEVVLLTRDLTANQTLVVVGPDGKRTDVEHGGSRHKQSINTIVLERWQVHLETSPSGDAPDLPVAYKKSIVVLRSLYTFARLLPTWQLRRRLARSKLTGNSLKISCQIGADSSAASRISITRPLIAGQHDGLESFKFHKVETTAGKLCISVDYRTNCNFRIDDSEALLSSQFLTSDQDTGRRPPLSLPNEFARKSSTRQSPFSHLSSSNNSMPYMAITDQRPASQPRNDRRPSATFIQPFKSPSLSASPSLDQLANSPRNLSRTPSSASIDRVNARTPSYSQSQRIPSSLGDGASVGDSRPSRPQPPQMIKRYSSSFGQRSTNFTTRRRSSQLSETGAQMETSTLRTSSRSPTVVTAASDEQELGDFVSLLDNRRPLAGSQFRDDGSSEYQSIQESMLQRSHVDLSRFYVMKESHINLSNSLLQPHSPRSTEQPPVRPLASPILTNMSLGSASPGKSVSPHTPAIPSRLSESSVMPRARQRRGQARIGGSPLPGEVFSEEHSASHAESPNVASDQSNPDPVLLPSARTVPQDTSRGNRSTSRITLRPSFSRARSDSSNSSSLRKVQDSIAESPAEIDEGRFAGKERPIRENIGLVDSRRMDSSPQPETAIDDEDLFFAMSDIHFGAGRTSDK